MTTRLKEIVFRKKGELYTVVIPDDVVVRGMKRKEDRWRLTWNTRFTLRYLDLNGEWRELLLNTIWDGDAKPPVVAALTEAEFWS